MDKQSAGLKVLDELETSVIEKNDMLLQHKGTLAITQIIFDAISNFLEKISDINFKVFAHESHESRVRRVLKHLRRIGLTTVP